MAIIAATGTGSFWNSTTLWTSGIIPGSGDIAIINGKGITLVSDIIVDQIRFDGSNYGYANGGNVYPINYTINANTIAGGGTYNLAPNISIYGTGTTVINCQTLIPGPNAVSGPAPTIGSTSFNNVIINTQTITANFVPSSAVKNISSGTITINSNIIVGNSETIREPGFIHNVLNGIININAKKIVNGVTLAGGTPGPTIYNASNGIINITGNITSENTETGGLIVGNNSSGIINIVGEINPLTSNCVNNVAGGTINISGVVRGTRSPNNTRIGITNAGTGTINVTGVVYGAVIGGASTTAGAGIANTANGTVNVVGSVLMEAGGTLVATAAILNSSVGTVVVSGDVTGASVNTSPAIHNASTGSVYVYGNATAGKAGPAVRNASTGYVYVKRAVGNDYGVGSVGVSYTPALQNDSTGPCYIEEFQFGNRGSFPLYGPITLQDKTSNIAIVGLSTGAMKTLADPTATSGVFPSGYDVRSGVVYNSGSLSGTMVVPNINSVSYGVAVDSGVGTAVLGGADFWNYLSSSIATSGSIGNRLKNCSTVETAGKQLENSLS